MRFCKLWGWPQLENVAVATPKLRRAVEGAVRAEDDRGCWYGPVAAAGKGIEAVKRPTGSNVLHLVNRAATMPAVAGEEAPGKGRAIEDACVDGHSGGGVSAVVSAGEGVKHVEGLRLRRLACAASTNTIASASVTVATSTLRPSVQLRSCLRLFIRSSLQRLRDCSGVQLVQDCQPKHNCISQRVRSQRLSVEIRSSHLLKLCGKNAAQADTLFKRDGLQSFRRCRRIIAA